MIQAPALTHPLYAVQFVRGVAPGARVPRAVQSQAAEALLARLREAGRDAPASSKSHARALCAAAIGSARIGVDVEFHEPRRDIRAIGEFLTGVELPGAAAAYRAVTFREAYFKATGEWPDRALLRGAAGASQLRLPQALQAMFVESIPSFSLCLVWEGGGAPERTLNDDAR